MSVGGTGTRRRRCMLDGVRGAQVRLRRRPPVVQVLWPALPTQHAWHSHPAPCWHPPRRVRPSLARRATVRARLWVAACAFQISPASSIRAHALVCVWGGERGITVFSACRAGQLTSTRTPTPRPLAGLATASHLLLLANTKSWLQVQAAVAAAFAAGGDEDEGETAFGKPIKHVVLGDQAGPTAGTAALWCVPILTPQALTAVTSWLTSPEARSARWIIRPESVPFNPLDVHVVCRLVGPHVPPESPHAPLFGWPVSPCRRRCTALFSPAASTTQAELGGPDAGFASPANSASTAAIAAWRIGSLGGGALLSPHAQRAVTQGWAPLTATIAPVGGRAAPPSSSETAEQMLRQSIRSPGQLAIFTVDPAVRGHVAVGLDEPSPTAHTHMRSRSSPTWWCQAPAATSAGTATARKCSRVRDGVDAGTQPP